MSPDDILKQIASILSPEKVETAYIPASEGAIQPRLIAFLGNDYQKRERILTITAQEQVLPNKEKSEYIRVQFQITFPFQMQDKAVFEVGSLLHLINRLMELPGFEMDELENKLFYRYVLLSHHPEQVPTLYISILGLIMMILDLFTETIEKIAAGQSTFNDLLEEILEISKQFKA